MRVLVTDAAGFLGFHLVRRLVAEGHEVLGVLFPEDAADPHTPARASLLEGAGIRLKRASTPEHAAAHLSVFRPRVLVHLPLVPRNELREGPVAARWAGLELALYTSLLAESLAQGTEHVVLGSGAGVYGAGEKLPFAVDTPLDRPLGLRAATARSAENLSHAFAHAHGQPVTSLRFFSLYGPYGVATQAPLQFALRLLEREKVALYEGGGLRRDFVYVDDAVEVLVRAVERTPEGGEGVPPFALHNVGTGTPTPVTRVLELVEARIGRAAEREEVPLPRTSLHHTWADVRELQQAYGLRPGTPLSDGVGRTVDWLLSEEGAPWRPAPAQS